MKTTVELDINKVFRADNARSFNQEQLQRLQISIEKIGLQTPITVKPFMKIWCGQNTECYEIVAGGHRWEACGRLGHNTIEAYIETDTMAARLWEISENLDRAELTASERAELLAKWVELCGEENSGISSENRTIFPERGRGQPKSGINDAARQLGIGRDKMHRAVKIATKLTPGAKAEAVKLGLDDNESALVEAAKRPENQQVSYLQGRKSKSKEALERELIDTITAGIARLDEQAKLEVLLDGFTCLSDEYKQRFVLEINK